MLCDGRPWEVDEAILRRLPVTFEVPLPDVNQRLNILEVLLSNEPLIEDYRCGLQVSLVRIHKHRPPGANKSRLEMVHRTRFSMRGNEVRSL